MLLSYQNETQSVSNTNTAPCKGKPKCYTVGWKIFEEMKTLLHLQLN